MVFGGDDTHSTHTLICMHNDIWLKVFVRKFYLSFGSLKSPAGCSVCWSADKIPNFAINHSVTHSNEEFFSAPFVCSFLNELNRRSIGFFNCGMCGKSDSALFFTHFTIWDLLHFYLIRPILVFFGSMSMEAPLLHEHLAKHERDRDMQWTIEINL